MPAKRTRRPAAKPNPFKPRRRARRRPNPFARRENPGITGIVINGLWIGVGMWAVGFVGSITGPLLGGLTGSLPFGSVLLGLGNAYLVKYLADKTIGHGALIAAGAFASTAVGAVSSIVGGAGSLLTGVTNAIGGGNAPQIAGGAPPAQIGPAQTNPGGVLNMTAAAGGR
jgi:hypothetical protein